MLTEHFLFVFMTREGAFFVFVYLYLSDPWIKDEHCRNAFFPPGTQVLWIQRLFMPIYKDIRKKAK